MKLSKKLATLRGGFLFVTTFLNKLLINIYLVFFSAFIYEKYKV
jgi:hypothetical protein